MHESCPQGKLRIKGNLNLSMRGRKHTRKSEWVKFDEGEDFYGNISNKKNERVQRKHPKKWS